MQPFESAACLFFAARQVSRRCGRSLPSAVRGPAPHSGPFRFRLSNGPAARPFP